MRQPHEVVGRHALGASTAAMAVSAVSYANLPASEQAGLPPAEIIEAAVLSVAAQTAADQLTAIDTNL